MQPTTTRRPRMHRLPKLGARVSIHFRHDSRDCPNGTVGTVKEVLDGCMGPICGVLIADGRTIDVFWKKLRPAS
jgi:hypothetical protein